MIDLLSVTQAVMRNGGYSVWLTSSDKRPTICFEDSSILGFALIFENIQKLLGEWRQRETVLLGQFAPSLRSAGDKAWNVYTVLLTEGDATESEAREARFLEEDLHKTRKVCGIELSTRENVIQTFLPLLALQQQPLLEALDANQRFITRADAIAKGVADAVLAEDVTPQEVARLLGAVK